MSAHRLFGIELHADLDLPGALASGSSAPRVELQRATAALADWPSGGISTWETRIEGTDLAAVSTADGRLAIAWGGDCRFLFDVAGRRLLWQAPDPADPAWQRLLLDTVAYLVALELGREALHAAAVVIDGAAVAIAAPSGGGKSTLTAALLASGARLLSDDIVVVEPVAEGILAHPGPPVMNVPATQPLPGHEVLDRFGGELWTAVPVVGEPRRLQALVLLDRHPGVQERSERVAPSPLPVIPRLLAYPRTGERERRRFALAGDLADAVPIHRLVADSATPPRELAERVFAIAHAHEEEEALEMDDVHA